MPKRSPYKNLQTNPGVSFFVVLPVCNLPWGVLDKPSDSSLETFSLCQQLSVTNSFLVKVGTWCQLPLSVLDTWHEPLKVLYTNSCMR